MRHQAMLKNMSNFHHICEAFVAAVGMGSCVLVLDGIDELSGTLGQSMHQVEDKNTVDILPLTRQTLLNLEALFFSNIHLKPIYTVCKYIHTCHNNQEICIKPTCNIFSLF